MRIDAIQTIAQNAKPEVWQNRQAALKPSRLTVSMRRLDANRPHHAQKTIWMDARSTHRPSRAIYGTEAMPFFRTPSRAGSAQSLIDCFSF